MRRSLNKQGLRPGYRDYLPMRETRELGGMQRDWATLHGAGAARFSLDTRPQWMRKCYAGRWRWARKLWRSASVPKVELRAGGEPNGQRSAIRKKWNKLRLAGVVGCIGRRGGPVLARQEGMVAAQRRTSDDGGMVALGRDV